MTVFQVKLDQGAQEAEAQIQFERLLQALGPEKLQAWLQQASSSELKQVQVQRLCLNCMSQWHNGMVFSAETVWHNVTSIC